MRNENELTPAEQELETALKGLHLAPAAIDRDRLMFEAGKRAAVLHLRFWQGLAAVLVAGIGLSLAFRPASQPTERVVYVNLPQAQQQGEQPLAFATLARWNERTASASGQYLRLQRRVLAEGLDALSAETPVGKVKPQPPLTIKDLLGTSLYGDHAGNRS